MSAGGIDELVLQSFRFEQVGEFAKALKGYSQALALAPGHAMVATHYFRLLRDMRDAPPTALKIVWQFDPAGPHWETEWVRHLLSGLETAEIIDGHHAEFHDGAIVVDRRITPEQRAYYFEMMRRGYRFVLFHLSDESYADDCVSYGFSNLVLRHYWSRAHVADKNVLAVPLGTVNGFNSVPSKPAQERGLSWFFAGNVNKRSREKIAQALSPVEGGHFHRSDAVDPIGAPANSSERPLPLAQYAAMLGDAIFAPCPAGWENLDSFRVCEALESGCIPIVEKRPHFDYFRELFGEHPMITVSDWNEAAKIMNAMRRDLPALDTRRQACAQWWRAYKSKLVESVRDRVLQSFGTP